MLLDADGSRTASAQARSGLTSWPTSGGPALTTAPATSAAVSSAAATSRPSAPATATPIGRPRRGRGSSKTTPTLSRGWAASQADSSAPGTAGSTSDGSARTAWSRPRGSSATSAIATAVADAAGATDTPAPSMSGPRPPGRPGSRGPDRPEVERELEAAAAGLGLARAVGRTAARDERCRHRSVAVGLAQQLAGRTIRPRPSRRAAARRASGTRTRGRAG